jgi:hypothetical protein
VGERSAERAELSNEDLTKIRVVIMHFLHGSE